MDTKVAPVVGLSRWLWRSAAWFAIIAVFALFHGYAHGQELPSAADPIGYSAGFVLCTGLLHLAGIALGTLRTLPAGTVALRGVGGLMALVGLWFSFMALSA